VIERKFQDAEGAKTVRSSHSYFGFVVWPLDHAAGKLLPGLEIVEQQRAMVRNMRADEAKLWRAMTLPALYLRNKHRRSCA
jgi:hypothetical protein